MYAIRSYYDVLHVHDIVDKVSKEAEIIAEGVAEHLRNEQKETREVIQVAWDENIRYVLPSKLSTVRDTLFSMRVREPGKSKKVIISSGSQVIKKKGFTVVNPAEMIQVSITGEELEGIDVIKVELQ